jgi:NitT/TauT family transport system ATP-binding protein
MAILDTLPPAAVTTAPALVPATAAVSLRRVTKRFGATLAIEDLNLEVRAGEFVCIVGASGCGKTTLLNLVAGLEQPSAGECDVRSPAVAMMFQDGALFPWLTAAQNVEMALRLRGVGRRERKRRARELLDLVHLGHAVDRRPHELSGGMRQRVALARAFGQDAELVLMDEPFGALDAFTRDLLHEETERIWRDAGVTVIFVTHNVREAIRLGDRVVLMRSRPGKVAEEFDVHIERPRRIEDAAVGALSTVITARLREEVRSHGDPRPAED